MSGHISVLPDILAIPDSVIRMTDTPAIVRKRQGIPRAILRGLVLFTEHIKLDKSTDNSHSIYCNR